MHQQLRTTMKTIKRDNYKPYRSADLRKVLMIKDNIQKPQSDLQLSVASNFIEKFQTIQDSFSFIIDFSTMQYLYMSKSCAEISGHKEWHKHGVEYAMSLYHPDDEEAAQKIHSKKTEHFYSIPLEERIKYKYTHDFRIRHADGHFIRVNHHAILLEFDEFGNPLSSFCICNDITNLKHSTTINFEISKLNENNIYRPILQESHPIKSAIDISTREYDVLTLLSKGHSNKEIAKELFISEHTVKDHRKNMLRKNNVPNINKLISLAWENKVF